MFSDQEEDPLRITYYKLMMNAVMPIFCGICAYITWYFIYKCDKKNKGRKYSDWKD